MKKNFKNIFTISLPAVTLLILSVWCWLKPESSFSDSERRTLASFPELSSTTVLNGEFMGKFETYTQDQFPLRDTFRGIKAFSVLNIFSQSDNNKIYLKDGHLSKNEFPLNEEMIKNASDKFNSLYEKYLKDKNNNVYLSIIPDKNMFLSDLKLDYPLLTEMIKKETPDFKYIDITELLDINDYYRTDTHWKQENISDVAEKIAKEMNADINAEYQENTLNKPFYGVYSGQYSLPVKPDTLKYLTNDTLNNCIVTSYDTGSPVQKHVYDMEKANGRDPYEMFMSGSDALLTVENPNCDNGKHLIMFRDSFASSISPLFIESYSKITLIDIRYINSDMLGQFVNFENSDVLFLYSTLVLNNSLSFK